MKNGVPDKWRSIVNDCLAETRQEVETAGQVELFLDVLVSVAADAEWLHYRTALDGVELPPGYFHVRVASDDSCLPDAQIYSRGGGRVHPASVLLAATCNGRRKIDRIHQTKLPGGRAGVLDLNVVVSDIRASGDPDGVVDGTAPFRPDCPS